MLPAAWPGYRARRRFRGTVYEITVRKPVGVVGRLATVSLDGRPLDGGVVPPVPLGSEVRVEAVLEEDEG